MPIVWRGSLDMGALGRRIGPGVARTKGGLALNVAAALGVSTNVPTGLHWFPKSACGVYRGKGWMASMKCETASIIGKERGNNDNLLGRVFEIVIPHGRRPSGASCSWRVRP